MTTTTCSPMAWWSASNADAAPVGQSWMDVAGHLRAVVGRLPTVTATVDGGGRPGDDFPSPARKSIIVDRRHVRT